MTAVETYYKEDIPRNKAIRGLQYKDKLSCLHFKKNKVKQNIFRQELRDLCDS
jgi:hypothetical protein